MSNHLARLLGLLFLASAVVASGSASAAPKHHHGVHHRPHHRQNVAHHREQGPVQTDAYQSSSTQVGSSSSLVAEARKYLGTNPTNRRSLWCGAFMDFILRKVGLKGGGNLATGYLHYGRRVSGPRVGAIAVMYRRGQAAGGGQGGHVGVVAGIDPNGNPIIISGNHGNTVAKSVYPRQRIAAYVEP